MMLATDWTYDLFVEDAGKYNATPRKGVHCNSNASERESFMVWFKNCARDFKAKWVAEGRTMYDRCHGWIGDAFARELGRTCFSDYYKDAYNQRPHLPAWYYVQATGLPHSEDTARTFCASPVKDAANMAKRVREMDF